MAAGALCIPVSDHTLGILHLSDDLSMMNMDLLVAGLQAVDTCGLHQFGSLVDRKRKRKDI